MVTLADGTIVAATDARWNTTGDGGGLDTIVSSSTDAGATWNYTFANYLGDNGNAWNNLSTCFIDPALATDGSTTHMVVDLFPAGIALNSARWSPQAGSGFDENGNLKLRDADLVPFDSSNNSYSSEAAAASYDYYLDLTSYMIRRVSDGSEVEGYAVDDHFNITSDDGSVSTNLFCADSPYQVYPTNYLYLTSSADAGATWSAPTLINVKDDDEQTLLIGPGTGSVLEDGTIVYSVYEYSWGTQVSGIIWSTDGGKTWQRSADTTNASSHWSSEAVAVQIDDTTIRQFYRDGYSTLYYTDFTLRDGIWTPGSAVDTGVTKTSNNQLSAIKYSGKIDGHDAIIVSTAASGSSSRVSGRLYVGLINDDKTMTWQYAFDVVPEGEYYSYSTLAELADGSVAVLYENSNGTERYEAFALDEIVCDDTNVDITTKDVSLNLGESAEFADYTGDYTSADVSELDTGVATLALARGEVGETWAQLGSDASFSGDLKTLSGALYTFADAGDGSYVVSATDTDGTTVYLSPSVSSAAGYPNSTTAENVTVSAGAFDGSVYLRGVGVDGKAGGYVYFDKSTLQLDRVNSLNGNETWMKNCSMLLYRPVADGEASSDEIPGYVQVTDVAKLDGRYLIVAQANNGEFYVLYPTTSTASKRAQVAHVVPNTTSSTKLTFTGVGEGSTSVRVGDVVYRVSVTDPRVSVSFGEGGTQTFTVAGDLSGADLSGLDTSVATVEISTLAGGVSNGVAEPLSASEYAFANDGAGGFTASAVTASGDTVYLSPSGVASGFPYSKDEASLTVSEGSEAGTFYLYDGSRYLFFWKDPSKSGHGTFDRTSTTTGFEDGCSFALFRRSDDGEGADEGAAAVRDAANPTAGDTADFAAAVAAGLAVRADADSAVGSEIPGYERVTDLSDVTDGSYLVAAQDDTGAWYVLHPSTNGSSKTAHVATVVDKALSTITFTAVGPGTTSVTIGGVPYVVTVAADEGSSGGAGGAGGDGSGSEGSGDAGGSGSVDGGSGSAGGDSSGSAGGSSGAAGNPGAAGGGSASTGDAETDSGAGVDASATGSEWSSVAGTGTTALPQTGDSTGRTVMFSVALAGIGLMLVGVIVTVRAGRSRDE